MVLVIQNNGWAISVPRARQSAVPTLAARGFGFGIPSVQVDGNDVLAVYAVMQQAIERARSGQGPTLVATLTYRIGPHTTADDATRYRDASEVEAWRAKDPIARFRHFLMRRNLLDAEQDQQLITAIETEVNTAWHPLSEVVMEASLPIPSAATSQVEPPTIKCCHDRKYGLLFHPPV